ncbi:MAG: trehalose-phosphatase [Chloroflexi bacterium]|nr:trehalose-phosphatase [Chloroflexota bacterium]
MSRETSIQPPNVLDHLDDLFSVVTTPRFGLAVDFDGTLSELASTPGAAKMNPSSAIALAGLRSKLPLVAVISGRSALDVQQKVGLDGVHYVGNHGAEYLLGDNFTIAPGVEAHRATISTVYEQLRESVKLPGIVWEDKGLSAAVHYRQVPETEDARSILQAAVDSIPQSRELDIFWGKQVLEIRTLSGVNKGYAVQKLAADYELNSFIFIGDDATDVDAMIELRRLSSDTELVGLGIAVLHADAPESILTAATYSIESVGKVGEFLNWMQTALG